MWKRVTPIFSLLMCEFFHSYIFLCTFFGLYDTLGNVTDDTI